MNGDEAEIEPATGIASGTGGGAEEEGDDHQYDTDTGNDGPEFTDDLVIHKGDKNGGNNAQDNCEEHGDEGGGEGAAVRNIRIGGTVDEDEAVN